LVLCYAAELSGWKGDAMSNGGDAMSNGGDAMSNGDDAVSNGDDAVSNGDERITAQVLYEENATSYRCMCDWRHRIMARFFLAVSAYMVAGGWIWNNFSGGFQRLICVPFLLSSVTAAVFWLAERRNTVLINTCYAKGRELEERYGVAPGIYSAWDSTPPSVTKARIINRGIYIAVGILTMIAFLVTLFVVPTGKP